MKYELTSQTLVNPFEILILPLTAVFREEFSMPFQILEMPDIEPARM